MTAQQIISEWNGMTGEEQFNFCQNCVRREIKQGGKLKPGMEFDDAVQDTAERVIKVLKNPAKLDADTERREGEGKATNTLAAIVCRAAHSSMVRMAYHSDKDSKATSRTITTEDGSEIDMLDTIAATDDTEEAAIIRATLKDFYNGLDSKNKIIFGGMMKGKTEREIAPAVEISNIAVHNRMVKIRAQLAAIL